jgi:hypothetical protein
VSPVRGPTYQDLLAEALARLPGLSPEWTDFSPSDPGVAVLELLAWISESMIFRAGRVHEPELRAFVRLVRGPDYTFPEGHDLEDILADARRSLGESTRDVTPGDLVDFLLTHDGFDPHRIARVLCLPDRDWKLPADDPAGARPGHLRVVVVPDAAPRVGATPREPAPDPALLAAVRAALEPRRLLTAHNHVVAPVYVPIKVRAKIYLFDDAHGPTARDAIRTALLERLDPLTGGEDGRGWPFGRNVYTSEIGALIDAVPGIDFLENLRFEVEAAHAARLIAAPVGDEPAIGVRLDPHELVTLRFADDHLELYERKGGAWQPTTMSP